MLGDKNASRYEAAGAEVDKSVSGRHFLKLTTRKTFYS
jgi:hypothetical protein